MRATGVCARGRCDERRYGENVSPRTPMACTADEAGLPWELPTHVGDDGGDKNKCLYRRLWLVRQASRSQRVRVSIAVGTPLASKPNGSFSSASRLVVNSYLIDQGDDDGIRRDIRRPDSEGRDLHLRDERCPRHVLPGIGARHVDRAYDLTQTLKARNDNTSLPTGVFCSQIATVLRRPGPTTFASSSRRRRRPAHSAGSSGSRCAR